MTIRRLEQADSLAFHEFRLSALKQCPEAFGATFEEESKLTPDQIATRLQGGPDDFILGAFHYNALVGIVGLMRQTRAKRLHSAQVWGMFVAPEARRLGAGSALLLDLIERARGLEGLLQLHLSVVTRCRAARRLYVVHGFESYGVEPRAHKQGDEWLDMEHMILRLE